MCVCVYLTCSICLSQINPDKVFSNRRNPQDLPIMWVKFSNTALKHQNCVNLYLLYHRTELMINFKHNIMNSRTGSSLKLLVLVFSGFYLPWPPHPHPHPHHISPGLAATTIAYPPLPSGPQALQLHKGALTREKKEPVPLGRDYIPIRFFSPLGQPPLNPPLPWLESEQGKAGWVEKKVPHMSDEVLHSCME